MYDLYTGLIILIAALCILIGLQYLKALSEILEFFSFLPILDSYEIIPLQRLYKLIQL